jgi:hypothetical protein
VLHALLRRKVRSLVSSAGYDSSSAAATREDTLEGSDESELEEQGYALREDTFTAMVFGRLCYLPMQQFWQVLKEACIPRIPEFDCEIDDRIFWPRWDLHLPHMDSSSQLRVEPDAIIRLEAVDIILEAKRRDGSELQRPEQLAREWLSWSQLPPSSRANKSLLLAVGGFPKLTNEAIAQFRKRVEHELALLGAKVGGVPLFAASWKSLRKSIDGAGGRVTGHQRLLLEDILSAFDLHDVLWKPPAWFSDFGAEVEGLTPIDLNAVSRVLSKKRRPG